MSFEIRDMLRQHAREVLTPFDRINWELDDSRTENSVPGDYELEMWYPHREGHDDGREVAFLRCGKPKIGQLTAQEIEDLGTVAQQISLRLPEHDVVLSEDHEGSYYYQITPKK